MDMFVKINENFLEDLMNTQTKILNLLEKQKNNENENLMTVKQAQKFLNISEAFLRKKIASGDLKVIKVGTAIRVEKKELFKL
ncbi:MAG: helix-turn-helix domain-containing protein [Sulfurimonas sp.]|nr:helix-turn-helix domain-containing protein [Sulfurimonas sp.]